MIAAWAIWTPIVSSLLIALMIVKSPNTHLYVGATGGVVLVRPESVCRAALIRGIVSVQSAMLLIIPIP